MFLLKRAELMREGRDVGILTVRRGLRVVEGEGTKHLNRKRRRKEGRGLEEDVKERRMSKKRRLRKGR
jgi:hypothetical protein